MTALAVEYWERRLEADPLEATIVGDRRFDDRMPDVSPAALDRELGRLRELRGRVEAVLPGGLPPADRVTRTLLLGEIDADLARGACRLSEWAVDPRGGPQVGYLRMADLQPVSTVVEAQALVARWHKMGAAVDQHGANLRLGLAAGKVATRDEVLRVLGQLDALLAEKPELSALRAPASKPHPDWPASDQQAFADGIDDAITNHIRPAFVRYRDVIADQILPRARDQAHVGLSFVPDGGECYRRLINVHTSLDVPPDEIHRFGLEEVARIRDEMKRVGAQALGTDNFDEIRQRLRSDPALYFSTREEIETTAREALARATAAMPRFLERLPRTACTVKRIESYEEKDSTIAYYQPASVRPGGGGATRPGTYYVNTYQPRARPRFEAEALAFHESVPGHHVQIAVAQELTGVPEFRKHLGVTAFVEGWGLYSERLADELGLYSDAHQRLGMLSFDAWRASRLVVDTGIHLMGWSRQRAITFMEENTALAPTTSPTRSIATSAGPRRRWPTRSASARSSSCARKPRTGWGRGSISAASTTSSWAAAPSA